MTKHIYPKPWTFNEEDIAILETAVSLGHLSKCQRLDKVEFKSMEDKTLGELRKMIGLTKEELYRIHETSPDAEKLLNVILRSYTGLFTEYAFISEDTLSVRTGLTRQQIYDILIALTQRRIIHYIPGKKTPYIIYTRERQEMKRLYFSKEVYDDRKASYIHRIEAMMDYADSDDKCRSRMLLLYFGEKNQHNCGQCDVCLSSHSVGLKQYAFERVRDKIEDLLAVEKLTSSQLVSKIQEFDNSLDRTQITNVMSYMLSEELIHQKDGILFVKV